MAEQLRFEVNFYRRPTAAAGSLTPQQQQYEYNAVLLNLNNGKRPLRFGPGAYGRAQVEDLSVPVICHGDTDNDITLLVGHYIELVAEQDADSDSLLRLCCYFDGGVNNNDEDYLEWRVSGNDKPASVKTSRWLLDNRTGDWNLEFLGSTTSNVTSAAVIVRDATEVATHIQQAITTAIVDKHNLSLIGAELAVYFRQLDVAGLPLLINSQLSQSGMSIAAVTDARDERIVTRVKCQPAYYFLVTDVDATVNHYFILIPSAHDSVGFFTVG